MNKLFSVVCFIRTLFYKTNRFHVTVHLFSDRSQVRLSLYTSQVAHQAGAYPSFLGMKRLGVFLLPTGCDASPSQGYPQH